MVARIQTGDIITAEVALVKCIDYAIQGYDVTDTLMRVLNDIEMQIEARPQLLHDPDYCAPEVLGELEGGFTGVSIEAQVDDILQMHIDYSIMDKEANLARFMDAVTAPGKLKLQIVSAEKPIGTALPKHSKGQEGLMQFIEPIKSDGVFSGRFYHAQPYISEVDRRITATSLTENEQESRNNEG